MGLARHGRHTAVWSTGRCSPFAALPRCNRAPLQHWVWDKDMCFHCRLCTVTWQRVGPGGLGLQVTHLLINQVHYPFAALALCSLHCSWPCTVVCVFDWQLAYGWVLGRLYGRALSSSRCAPRVVHPSPLPELLLARRVRFRSGHPRRRAGVPVPGLSLRLPESATTGCGSACSSTEAAAADLSVRACGLWRC